jgi:hypothetical protein
VTATRIDDVTVRTVTYALQNGDSPNLPCPYTEAMFRPDKVEVQFEGGKLSRVKVSGPVLTKTGRANMAMRSRAWIWSSGLHGRKSWPPKDAPDIARTVVAELLTPTD